MSEESQSNKIPCGRALLPAERELIERMLTWENPKLGFNLSSFLVKEMQDGGMGSIRFLRQDKSLRRLGKTVAKAEYIDEDGVPVSIVINIDEDGELFELDFWKVDFSPLSRYPKATEIVKAPDE